VSDNQPDFARFLGTFALLLGAGIGAVMAFVVLVDPYGLYGFVGPTRFNTVKPGLSRYQAEIKQIRAQRINPDFVILGNSRAEIGFDPKATALKAAGARGYNLAIPGVGIDTSMRQMSQLQAAGVTPKTVILGVEFLDFVRNRAVPSAPGATQAAVPAGPSFWQFDALFSLASVKDAIRTLRIQHDDEAITTTMDGFNPLKEYRGYVRGDGYYKIFQQRAEENSRSFRRKSTSALGPEDVKRLHAFLQLTAASKADVKLVIYPYHAQILAMFEAAGLWPLFEEWKRELAVAVAEATRNNPNVSITLLDFSGYGPYNCERIPDASEVRAATQWYWEAGHFKKELGDIVLARVMTEPSQIAHAPAFGTRIEASSVQANADRIAAERRVCAAAHPDMFKAARQLMAKASVGS
jgi:hypothetical protein